MVGELFHPWKIIFDTRETLEREKDELMKIHNLFLFLCSQKKKVWETKTVGWRGMMRRRRSKRESGGKTVEYHRA